MLQQCFQLDVPGLGDVDHHVGLQGERAPDFLWHMRQVAFDQQFREKNRASGRRKDRVHRCLAGGAVIGVIDPVGCEQGLRVAGDKDIRFELADDADNVAAQVQVRDEIAVRAIHKVYRLHANYLCRGDLLLMPDGAQGVGGHIGGCGGVEALIAAGQKLIGDVMPGA